jgi:hypothetical protein
MTAAEIRSAVEGFLTLVTDTKLSDEEAERTLPLILDRLALAVHFTPDATFEGYPESRDEYDAWRPRIGKRFPQLGFYPIADAGGEPGVEEATVGDATSESFSSTSTRARPDARPPTKEEA